MGIARAPVYENMNFPPYEYREYPKAINIPEGLEGNFELISNNTSNMVFSHNRDGDEIAKPSRPVIHQVMVNSEEEEAAVLNKIKKLQGGNTIKASAAEEKK